MLKFGNKGDINITYKCTIRLLSDTEILECEFQPHSKGIYLLEHVCKQLNLVEQDYFGLRFVDTSKQRNWLDLGKPVMKQIKEMDPILFSFRVKFYPPDPFILKEEITRYQLFLQLKRDLLHGRLYCNYAEAALLGAYIVQAELGDYNPEIHNGNYVSDIKLLLKQTHIIEEKISEIHQKQLKGQTFAGASTCFLKTACQLDTYGIDPHPVKDHKGNTIYLGINYLGILTFKGGRKTRHFNWPEIQKINYEGKMFIIHLVYYEKKHTVGFKCPTVNSCRYVWRCAVEQMLFFTLQKSADAPVITGGGLFSWGTKFKYSGRTEKEILQESRLLRMEEFKVKTKELLKKKASSVPATPSTPIGCEIRYRSLPRSNNSVTEAGLNLDYTLFFGNSPENPLPFLETVSEDLEQNSKKLEPKDVKNIGGATDKYCDSFDRTSYESKDMNFKANILPFHSLSNDQFSQISFRVNSKTRNKFLSVNNLVRGSSLSSSSFFKSKEILNVDNAVVNKFNIFNVFIPSFLFVAISLITGTILILETDSDLLSNLRGLPEMIILRKHYYEPAKEFITKKIFMFFSKD